MAGGGALVDLMDLDLECFFASTEAARRRTINIPTAKHVRTNGHAWLFAGLSDPMIGAGGKEGEVPVLASSADQTNGR